MKRVIISLLLLSSYALTNEESQEKKKSHNRAEEKSANISQQERFIEFQKAPSVRKKLDIQRSSQSTQKGVIK